jgi:glycopeptide antibiotics resistance protein
MYLYTSNLGIPLWPILVLMLIVILLIQWRRKHNFSYLLFFSFFGVYLMFGIDKVFFPLEINGSFPDAMRKLSILSSVNLVPFSFGRFGLTANGFILLLYNILLTVPFGFGLNFLTMINMKKILGISIILGLGLEVAQLLISLVLRYPYRVVDVNDAICNAIGVLLGYGLFKLFARLYLVTAGQPTDNKDGLSLYLYDVAHQELDDKKNGTPA